MLLFDEARRGSQTNLPFGANSTNKRAYVLCSPSSTTSETAAAAVQSKRDRFQAKRSKYVRDSLFLPFLFSSPSTLHMYTLMFSRYSVFVGIGEGAWLWNSNAIPVLGRKWKKCTNEKKKILFFLWNCSNPCWIVWILSKLFERFYHSLFVINYQVLLKKMTPKLWRMSRANVNATDSTLTK